MPLASGSAEEAIAKVGKYQEHHRCRSAVHVGDDFRVTVASAGKESDSEPRCRRDFAEKHFGPRHPVVREEKRSDCEEKANEDALRPAALVVRRADRGNRSAREQSGKTCEAQRDHADDEFQGSMVDLGGGRSWQLQGALLPRLPPSAGCGRGPNGRNPRDQLVDQEAAGYRQVVSSAHAGWSSMSRST